MVVKEVKTFGFVCYISPYKYPYNICTLQDLIKEGIEIVEEEERKKWIRERNQKLRDLIINKKASDYDLENAREIWPYIHSRCPHSLDINDKCMMCVNGCDFY